MGNLSSLSVKLKAYLALVVVYIVWGTTFGAIRLGVETIPPSVLVAIRFTVAGVLLIALRLFQGERWPDLQTVKRHCIVGFFLFACGNSVVSWAVQYIPSGLAGILTATNPFWVLVLSALLPPKERIQPLALVGLLIGFIGLLILLAPKMTSGVSTSDSNFFWPPVGVILVMTICWAIGTVYAKKTEARSSLLMGVGIQNLFAGCLLMPLAGIHIATTGLPVASFNSVLALSYLIAFGTIVAMPCYLYALEHLPIAVSSTYSYVTPVVTLLVGWLFLAEPMTPSTALGAGIILLGVVVVQGVMVQRVRFSPNLLALLQRFRFLRGGCSCD